LLIIKQLFFAPRQPCFSWGQIACKITIFSPDSPNIFAETIQLFLPPQSAPLRKAAFHRHDPGEGGHILGPWRKDKQQTEFSADLRIKGISFGGSEKNV